MSDARDERQLVLLNITRSSAGYLANAIEQLRQVLRNNALQMPAELEDLQRMFRLRASTGHDGSYMDTLASDLHCLIHGQYTPRLLEDLEGAAAALKLSESSVKRLVSTGELHAIHCGKLLRFRVADLQTFVDRLD